MTITVQISEINYFLLSFVQTYIEKNSVRIPLKKSDCFVYFLRSLLMNLLRN